MCFFNIFICYLGRDRLRLCGRDEGEGRAGGGELAEVGLGVAEVAGERGGAAGCS